MEFPKQAVNKVTVALADAIAEGDELFKIPCRADHKDIDEVLEWAEFANARIKELEAQNAALMFKVRCVAQALK